MCSNIVKEAHQGMLQYKGQMMGISITLIFLCHMCIGSWHILMVFAPCVIGCDIFMILSGASLGYSYQKNSLGKFYWRRITRIYPMFLVLTLATCAIKQITEGGVSAIDVVKGATFLSYYGWGGVISDWYLSISLLLYLCYPLLAKLNRYVLILVITLAVLTVEIVLNDNTVLNVQQLCGISRIPMFCWGVYLFFNSKEFKGKEVFIWYLFYACITLISTYFRLHLYWILDTIAPFFLLFLYWLCKHIISNYNWINNGLAFLGKYTLEIYVGNLIALGVVQAYNLSPLSRIFVYSLGTVGLSAILVFLNAKIQAAIKHIKIYD